MLKLDLVPVPPCHGIYNIRDIPFKSLRANMRYLHPDAAKAFAGIADWVVVSDMFRTPESSLQAVEDGRGAMPPGYSAHGYGLAIDIAITEVMNNLKLKRKADLDAKMEEHGFFCHRRDHENDKEAWHFNYLGVGAKVSGSFTSDEVEARIVALYGNYLKPDDTECQRMLAKLKLYGGDIDGDIGPRSRQAVLAFERTWGLPVDGTLDVKTRRTLAYVARE